MAQRRSQQNQKQPRDQQQKESFKAKNVAQFFLENRQLAGFENPTKAIYQTIRELVENSLDATDAHGILPFIYIHVREATEIDTGVSGGNRKYAVTVEDNGIGVPVDAMAEAFGRLLFSSKYTIRQQRGMFGLGVKAAVLYGQSTTGMPAEVISTRKEAGYAHMMKIKIDTRKNEPMVLEKGEWERRGRWHGTRVTIYLEANWGRAKSRILEYIMRTAVITPYAEIIFETPEGEVYYFPRTTKKMPKPPKTAKPHPHGITVEDLRLMLQQTNAQTLLDMMVQEFQSVGRTTAQNFLDTVGLRHDMKPKELLEMERKDPTILAKIVDAMKEFKFKAPRSDYLSPIGEDMIKIGLKRIYNPEWVDAITRKPKVHEGHPFIVEVGIAYGGNIPPSDKPIVLRYANKIPLLYEETQDVMYKVVVERINWKQYKVEFPAPLVVLVHIASTKVPYRGAGKESIIDHPEIEEEVKVAVQEVARRLKRFLVRKKKEEEMLRRVLEFSKYIPEVARSLAILAKPPEKWKPPTQEEIDMFEKALIKLVASKLEPVNIDGEEVEPEEIVKKIARSVKTE